MANIVVCDDDKGILKTLRAALTKHLHADVRTVESGGALLKEVQVDCPDLVLLDLNLPGVYGLNILKTLKANHPEVPVIIMTGQDSTQVVIDSTKDGAFDFTRKPFRLEIILEQIKKALALSMPEKKSTVIDKIPTKPIDGFKMYGSSSLMVEVYKLVGQVSGSDATVLIQGESGTGKEMIARSIYMNSLRKDMPFLAVNCAAIPDALLESELFGYEKGAFTGAGGRKIGKFEQCNNGTIFLDEIGDMSLATQSKILRILQEGQFERVGSSQTIQVDVRVIAATNVELEEAIRKKEFRLDLYYRLNVFTLYLPPLKDRAGDIAELAKMFIAKYSAKNKKVIRGITEDSIEVLRQHSWPGNVRELENCIERAVVIAKGDIILPEYLHLLGSEKKELSKPDNYLNLPRDCTLEEVERAYITHVLNETSWRMNEASETLDIHRNTLRRKIKALNIIPDDE